MLDAYIIERIRRERERSRKEPFVPLHIEDTRRRPAPDERQDDSQEPKRGSVVIDFQL